MQYRYIIFSAILTSMIAVASLVYFYEGGAKRNSDIIAEYTEQNAPEEAIVIAAFGQSNIGNHVNPKFAGEIPDNLLQFDWRSGNIYKYREPLLGNTGRDGFALTPFFRDLANATGRPVIAVPFAISSSSVLEWAYGQLGTLQARALKKAQEAGLTIDMFLWHQGERDSRLIDDASRIDNTPYFKSLPAGERPGLESGVYADALGRVIARSHAAFPNALFGIALVSRGARFIDEDIRDAQKRVAASLPYTFLTVDADAIHGKEYRFDGVHFSQAGAREVSRRYAESVFPRLID